MPKRKPPSTIYFSTRDFDESDDTGELAIETEFSKFADNTEVAVYQLVKVSKVKKTAELVDVKKSRR